MSIFNKNKNKKKLSNYALALDIGTSVAKALVVNIDFENHKGAIVGVGRVNQALGDMQSGAVTNIEGVVATASKAVEQACSEAKVEPDQVVLGIAGELVKGAKTTVRYERLYPENKIDMKEIGDILQKVQEKAFDKVRKQLAWETGHSEIDVKLINAAVVEVRIDGYRVTNPLGFQGKDVVIGIFNAYAPLIHLGALESIANDLGLDLLSITAEPYAVAKSLSEDSENFGAIFIDIGGGTTDVAVVHKGGIEGTKMFALGGKAFTKRIADELQISFSEAEELKIRYSKDKLAPDAMVRMKEILSSDVKIWLSGVELALKEFKNLDLLPSKFYICGGGSLLPGIKSALQGDLWYENLPFTRKPMIKHAHPKEVQDIMDKTGKLKNPIDITPMGLANVSLDLAGEESAFGSVLNSITNTMQT